MTIAEKILLIIACAVLLLVVLWVIGVRNMLKKLKNKVKESYKELRNEVGRLYDFADRAAEKFTACGVDIDRITAIKAEAQEIKGIKNVEAKAECDAILQSRLKNALEKTELEDELRKEYDDIEIDIVSARKKYNAAVREYNCQRKIFPDRIVSAVFRYKPIGFYTADQIEEE